MGDLLSSRNNANLVQRADLGTQASVNAKHLAIDDSRKCEEVEDLAACLPYRRVSILCLALFVESVDLGDLSRFVISAD